MLAERAGERLGWTRGARALVARSRLGTKTVVGAVPQTYMNDSGLAVAALVRRHGIEDLSTWWWSTTSSTCPWAGSR